MSKPKKIAVKYVESKRTKTAQDEKIRKAKKDQLEATDAEVCQFC